MAKRIVNILKTVHIQKEQCYHLFMTGCIKYCAFKVLFKECAVRQAGQTVKIRKVTNLFFSSFAVGYILNSSNHPICCVRPVNDYFTLCIDSPLRAIRQKHPVVNAIELLFI